MKLSFGLIGLAIVVSGCGELTSQIHDTNSIASKIAEPEPVVVGDILIDPDTYEQLQEMASAGASADNSEMTTQAILLRGISRWPNGILPIQFDQGFSQPQKNKFFEYCAMWGETSSVRCVSRTNQRDFVMVRSSRYKPNTSACYAQLGYRPGMRQMWLPGNCINSQRSILHELGHVLGLLHEHQRPDRERFLNVNWGNIRQNYRRSFEVLGPSHAGQRSRQLDFASIMMYGSFAFSQNSQPTLVKYNENKETWDTPTKLSPMDRAFIGELYRTRSPSPTPSPSPPPSPTPPGLRPPRPKLPPIVPPTFFPRPPGEGWIP